MRAFSPRSDPYYPFALVDLRDADLAASNVTHGYQLAATPVHIDGEDIDRFSERWMTRLAQAAMGGLQEPSVLPEPVNQ
jgi:hypothetical protein